MTPHELIDRFVLFARQGASDTLSAADQAGLQRLERTLARRTAPGRRAWTRWVWVAVAVAGAFALVVWRRDPALTFEVKHGHVSEGGYIVPESENAMLHFSDESLLGLEPGTRLRVSHLEVRGALVMLEGGLLHVHIHPRPNASWAIDAGPYVVHVTGTEFDLAWEVGEQTLDLQLRKGRVTVEGPLANGTLRMEAGQHLVANARDGSITVANDRTADAPSAPSALAGAAGSTGGDDALAAPPGPAEPLRVLGSRAVGTSARKASGDETTWAGRVARGDFSGIVEDAERRGLTKTLTDAPAGELAALADAARYARRQDIARRALIAERTRFPSSVQAHDAAFFLGGLAEGANDDAGSLLWYQTYLRENAAGTYAAESLGRTLAIVARVQGVAPARAVATEYLQRFGDGPYAPSARKLLQRP